MVGTETAEPSTPNGGVKCRCPPLGICNLANHRSSAYCCAHFCGEITNDTIAVGNERLLHLHCFQHYDQVTGCDLFPGIDGDFHDCALHGGLQGVSTGSAGV